MKRFTLCLSILCSSAMAQLPSGTIVVVIYQHDRVTVAADSKLGGAGDVGTYCKISAFGDKFIFAAANHVALPQKNGGFRWAADDARDIWRHGMDGFTGEHITDAIAANWGALEAQGWQDYLIRPFNIPARVPVAELEENGGMVIGLFAGFENGKPRIIREMVTYDQPLRGIDGFVPAVAWFHVVGEPPAGGYTVTSIGRSEIVEHMQRGEIEKARIEDPFNWQIKAAERLVKLTIDLHPRHDQLGGPIDIIQWNGYTGSTNWIRRKPECPSQ
jgi:hypothetical protein